VGKGAGPRPGIGTSRDQIHSKVTKAAKKKEITTHNSYTFVVVAFADITCRAVLSVIVPRMGDEGGSTFGELSRVAREAGNLFSEILVSLAGDAVVQYKSNQKLLGDVCSVANSE